MRQGHTRGIQHLRNVPEEVVATYLAEDCLDWGKREANEGDFTEFFGRGLP